ncbi:hypothetical protein D3C72_1288760 [compost metagenome]
MVMDDLIKEIVRLKGSEKGIEAEMKYLISKLTPIPQAIEVAKNCMDEHGNLILDKLPAMEEVFPTDVIQYLQKYDNWKDLAKELDKRKPSKSVNFGKSLHIMMSIPIKPKNKNPRS